MYSPHARRHIQLGRTGQRQSWIFARRRNRLRGWPLLYPSSSEEMRSACASVLQLPALEVVHPGSQQSHEPLF